MTNEERRKAAEWFKNRAKNCPMPATRRMYEIATKAIEALPSAQPEQTDCDYCHEDRDGYVSMLPSAQSTLYGYKIEHLAYIARVMEKEGITAEDAVRTFDNMSRAIRMIIEEAQQKAEEMLNEQFNKPAGGN